jgi:hypothetical protein
MRFFIVSIIESRVFDSYYPEMHPFLHGDLRCAVCGETRCHHIGNLPSTESNDSVVVRVDSSLVQRYTATDEDMILVDTSSERVVVDLPSPHTLNDGHRFAVKHAGGTNDIVVGCHYNAGGWTFLRSIYSGDSYRLVEFVSVNGRWEVAPTESGFWERVAESLERVESLPMPDEFVGSTEFRPRRFLARAPRPPERGDMWYREFNDGRRRFFFYDGRRTVLVYTQMTSEDIPSTDSLSHSTALIMRDLDSCTESGFWERMEESLPESYDIIYDSDGFGFTGNQDPNDTH